MSQMTIGELVGYVDLDVDGLAKGAKQGQKDIGQMTAAVLAAAEQVEKTKFTAKLDADARALEERVFDAEELLRYIDQYKSTPKIDADITAAEFALQEVRAELDNLHMQEASPEVDAEIAAAEANLRQIEDQLNRLNYQRATVDVDAETDRVRYELIQLESQLASINSQRIRIRVDVDNAGSINKAAQDAAQLASRAMSVGAAVAGIGAGVPAVAALGAALVAAASAAALLPGILGAAAAGIGALMVGFTGVGDAITAMGQQDTASAGASSAAGSQREAALKAVESAQRSLEDAQTQAARTAIQGAQQIADAQEAVADAVRRADQVAVDGARQVEAARQAVADAYENAARRVESAEASLERAQASAQSAQEGLNRAREDAKERIEDLSLALSGAALDEESAQLRLEKAQIAMQKAASKGTSSLEYREAALGVRQAEQALAETKERYQDVQQESTKANQAGVDGADNVVAAQRRVDEANDQVMSSQKAVDQARVDGAKQVEKAQQRLRETEEAAAQANIDAARDVEKAKQQLARTEQQVAWANEDAAKRVADAQRALADAIEQVGKSAGGGGAGGVNKYADALAKLSPEAREFVKALEQLKPRWDALTRAVQDKLFDGLAEEILALADTYLPMLQSMLVTIAGGFNTAFKGLSQWLQQGPQVEMMKGAFERIGNAVSLFAQALDPIGRIFFTLMAIGSEWLPGMAQGFLDGANSAAEFVTSAEGMAKIREWIADGLVVLGQLWDILVNVGRIIGAVFGAGNEGGTTFLATLVRLTDQLATFLEQPATQQALASLFQFLADNGPMLMALAAGMWGLSKAIAGVAGSLRLIDTVGDIGAKFGLWKTPVNGFSATVVKAMGTGLMAIARFATGLAIKAVAMAASWLIAMGPIGWIVLAVAALAALIYFYWDEIKLATIAAWTFMSAWLGALWEQIKTTAIEAWAGFVTWLVGLWEGIKSIFFGACAAVVAFLVGTWANITGTASAAWSAFITMLSGIWESIKQTVATGVAAVVTWLVSKWLEAKTSTETAWRALLAFLGGIWDSIKQTVSAAAQAVVDWLRNAWENAKNSARAGWDNLVTTVRVGVDNAINWVKGLPGRILSALGNLGTLLWNSGSALVQGFLDGIAANWQRIVGYVQQGMSQLRALWPFSPAKKGPFSGSGYVTHSGRALTSDFASSLQDGMPGIIASARMVMDGAKDALSPGYLTDFSEIEAYANGQLAAARARMQAATGTATGLIPGARGDEPRAGTVINVNNPVAERASDSLNREARSLDALGVL